MVSDWGLAALKSSAEVPKVRPKLSVAFRCACRHHVAYGGPRKPKFRPASVKLRPKTESIETDISVGLRQTSAE